MRLASSRVLRSVGRTLPLFSDGEGLLLLGWRVGIRLPWRPPSGSAGSPTAGAPSSRPAEPPLARRVAASSTSIHRRNSR
ncbi:MAG: hypothetical protein ACK550_06330 [Synechococcaceae cyanobacterium]